MTRLLVTLAVVASGAAWLGCCPSQAAAPGLATGAEGTQQWRRARTQLAELQARYRAPEPYSMNVSLELTQLQLGQRMRARGVVAVRPPDGLRMILLGPGGTTALDLWICRDAFRFSVPAIDLERRGDATTPPEQLRGLPVAFLRWWFLHPLEGRLLSAQSPPGDRLFRHFVLREDAQIMHLLRPAATGGVELRRIGARDEERLQVAEDRCGRVAYTQRSTGLDIQVECEGLNETPPPARAFADPDDATRGCGGVEVPLESRGG